MCKIPCYAEDQTTGLIKADVDLVIGSGDRKFFGVGFNHLHCFESLTFQNSMSYGIHPAAKEEYLNSIRWMIRHYYDRRALARFIDEIETGIVAIDNDPHDFPQDPCGRPGWRFYGPTKTFRYVIRYIEDLRGEPYIMAINAPYRKTGYWKARKPQG